jgi:beta-galactosidase
VRQREGQSNRIVLAAGGASYRCTTLCDILHCEGAHVLATYGDDFYAGAPAVTQHRVGRGAAYYIASDPEERFLDDFYGRLLGEQGITPLLDAPPGIEVTLRESGRHRLLYVLNHTPQPASVPLPAGTSYWDHLSRSAIGAALELPGYGVAILEQAGAAGDVER